VFSHIDGRSIVSALAKASIAEDSVSIRSLTIHCMMQKDTIWQHCVCF